MNPDFYGIFKALKEFFKNDLVYGVGRDFHQFICLFVAQKTTLAREIVNSGTCVLLKRSNSLGGPNLFIYARWLCF